ncbi:hypothetical protein EJB05_31532 [Eragrostis curvula]|uniref:Uncharacterized protein n=1 Tax=Eragrostis curvula TaxID=38414 RepID=A0A5J9UDW4_9POAL|nr:hypothetical protein EJB05_31532 [Eragrostis curvula]
MLAEGSMAPRQSGCSPRQQTETSLCGQTNKHPVPNLPEDIWFQIHSLVPMRDAARVACVSRAFAHSWRYHRDLVFSEETLGINVNACRKDEKMRDFTSKVDCILKKHSGIGVKTLRFQVGVVYSAKDCCHLDHLDSWLQIAVKPGIEELNLTLSSTNSMYNFPCSLLSGGTGDFLRYLVLVSCHFHPTKFICLKSLTRLRLHKVDILEDELECLLSNSFSLEHLKLGYCKNIFCLKIPCLQRLSSLEVSACGRLQAIESKAPNLSNFSFAGNLHVRLSLGGTPPIKKLFITDDDAAFYARAELPSRMPNLEALSICSRTEAINTPMVNSKFLHLKFLNIILGGRDYDFLSLVSFFDASPSLETFRLTVLPEHEERISIFVDPLDLRTVPEHLHDKLKLVEIINFSSAKSLIELICHILQSSRSLERLTLDTTQGFARCSVSKSGKCLLMRKDALVEAGRALLAVETYIKPIVSSTVELNAVEPCSRCHAEQR